MKKLYFLSVCFSAYSAVAQQVVVANLKENIVYCGVDNPLSVLIEGHPCSSVILTVDNGKITKTGCGYFIYRPVQLGHTSIKIWVRNKTKLRLVSKLPYRSKSFMPPVAFIGASTGGNINLKTLKAMGGVRAVLLNSGLDANFQIISYTPIAVRDSLIVFTNKNAGAKYSDILLKNIDDLKIGDSFLISNIICKGPDEKEWKLAPLEFTIIE